MLDLNLNVVENELTPHDDSIRLSDKSPEVHSRNQVAESTTSNSSIVNVDGSGNGVGEDDSCSTRATGDFCTLNFGILKVEAARDVMATKDLFPLSASTANMKRMDGNYDILQGQSSSSTKSLTGFSFDHGGGGTSSGGLTMVRVQVQQHLAQPHPQQQVKKSRRGPRSRSSQYRGVTYYRRTGRWESHIWDCGKQVYLGGFDTALTAARAYDRAAIRFRGVDADINFNLSDYEEDMKQMKNLTKEEFVHVLRRQSTGFSRGSSKYRGVTLHKCGRWEARMGQFLGKKAYDKAAIKWNGREAVTSFQPSTYESEVKPDQGNEGSNYNLDLNLSISTSFGNDPKENLRLVQFQSAHYDIHRGTSLSMENNANPTGMDPDLKGQVVREGQPSAWNSVYPGLFPNKGMSKENITIGASQGLPNGAWQKHSEVTVAPALSPMSTAASSGFSFVAPFPSSSFLQLKSSQSTAYNNICFASSNTAATANSQYLRQLESPQAPP